MWRTSLFHINFYVIAKSMFYPCRQVLGHPQSPTYNWN